MIRPIDIRLNAAHPELPLAEAVTFTGAPSTVLIRGVPPNCGRWAITAVFVAATFPDGSTTTRAAVQSANGVWVATLPATARSGRTANGIRVMADGIDENGEAVTGYILGVADFAVASLGVTPAPEPGETSWQMLYFDAVPATLRKGDVTKIDGVLKLYNGTAWAPFTDLSDYYTAEQVDEAIDKLAAYYITADAQGNPFATHAALVNAQTYYSGGAVRTPTRNDYAVVSADETHGGAEWRYIYAVDAQGAGQWEPQYAVEGVIAYDNTVTRTSANGVKSSGIWSAIWGALSALPTGFSSLYDWCVAQLAGKADKSDLALRPTMFGIGGGVWVFANEGEGFIVVNSEVTSLPASKTSIGYDEYADNHSLSAVYAPNVLTVGKGAFTLCTALTTISLPAATSIGEPAFDFCTALTTLDLSSFAKAQILANASTWGINPTSGHSITVTASDETFTITGE